MKVSVLKKVVSAVIVLSMLLGILPATNVFAASIANEYTYYIRVKNGDVKYAGTDNDIYCIVETVSGAEFQEKIDSKSNDFERNDDRTYSVELEVQPWEIKYVGLKNGGKDGANFAWFKFKLPNGTWIHRDVYAWFEKGNTAQRKYLVWGDTDRQVKSRGNFDSNFSGTKYFDVDATSGSDIVMEWNGTVSDQYFSNYNIFKYAGAVGVSFYPKATSYGYSGISSISQMEDNSLASVSTKDGFDNKLTIKTGELLKFMKNNKIYKLDIKSAIEYDVNTDEYGEHSKNYVIYRKGFELEAATAITAAYTPEKDNNFYNSEDKYKTFEIKIPVKSMDNYSASTIASSLASNIKSGASTAKIYYGKLENNEYITPNDAYSSGSNIYLKGTVPSGFANSANVSITAVIENAKATYNGQTYVLDRTNARYEHYISTHKVDTKGLTHTVKDESGNTVTGFNTYEKEHKFQLQVDAGADIYIDNNKGGRSEGFFSYRLYTNDNKSEIPLEKHNGITATSLVPHAGNSIYRIAATEKVEGDYKLVISSRDFANNLESTTFPVKLDTIAPRATFTLKQVAAVDGSKSNQYKFNITDASGTGRLYYAFVYNGDPIPDSSDTKPESSGPTDTVYGKWGFIDQKNTNAQTVVLYLEEDKFFEGKLYWYTVDDAGNDSRTERNSGTTADGYYYEDIELYNVSEECEITLDDITPGKPEYEIGFETSSLNSVEYKWIGGGLTTPATVYTASSRPGAAVQKDGSGNSVTMNGNYTLEYVVITPNGHRTTYTKDFLFDNTNPEITFGAAAEAIGPSKKLSITVKDISNIEAIKYQLYTAGGEAVGEETELSAGLPVVSNEIVLTPEKSGAYKVKITATDVNGQSSERESDVFSIRNAAPVVTVDNNILSQLEERPITNSQEYMFYIEAVEAVDNVSDFASEQVMIYRTSADGVNYTEWSTVSATKYSSADGEGHRASADIPSPVALNNGDNRIYVQVAFVEKDADTSKIRNELIATNDEMIIIYDTQAPQYKISIDDSDMTNESVMGTITFIDNYTPADQITFVNNSWYILETLTSSSPEQAVYALEITENVEDKIYLTDTAGNETAIPITVKCIDTEAPEYLHDNGSTVYSGDRNDYYLSFYVDKAIEGETQFALVESANEVEPKDPNDTSRPEVDPHPTEIDDSLFGPMPDLVEVLNIETAYNYENGESKTLYEVMVRGGEEVTGQLAAPEYYDYIDYDAYNQAYNDWVAAGSVGDEPLENDYYDSDAYWAAWNEWDRERTSLNTNGYVFAVKTSDALGNTSKGGAAVVVTNRTAEITETWCVPQKAATKTALVIQTSVPVYIMPQDKIPTEITALNLPDGRIDNSENAVVTDFAEDIINSATGYTTISSLVIDSVGDREIYFTDECDRVYKQTVKVRDLSDDSEEYNALICYVSFGNEAPVKASFYQAYGDDYEMSNWTELHAGTTEALDFASGYNYYVVLEPAPGENQTVSLTGWDHVSSTINDGYYIDDFEMVEDLSELSVDDDGKYARIVYRVCDTANPNKVLGISAYVTINDPNEHAEPFSEEVGGVFELNLKDATGPEVDVSYSTKGYTNKDVIVTVSASDPELAENTDAADTNSSGEDPTSGAEVELKEFTDAELAQQAGIRSIAVSEISEEYIPEEGYASLTYTDLGQVAQTAVTFENNGYAVVKVTNTLGLVSYEQLEVLNINKAAIAEGTHYNIKYYIDNGSGETEVSPDGYYKEVIAEIEFTEEGENDRELYVSNNMRENRKTLDSYDNAFTFNLKDKYGNTADVTVEFNRFDLDGPIVSYEPSNTQKTNQPFDVYLKVYDFLTSVENEPTLTAPDGTELTVTYDSEVTEEEKTTKIYKATVGESGLYKITATDILGNISYMNFIINNIDKTAPYVTEKMTTSTGPTRQTVGVKLYYSKPGVVITRAEAVEQGSTTISERDFVVDYTNSAIRFHENGSVAVEFIDEYGNTGTDTVNVSNINRTPPSVEAVKTTAADLLSVDVSFAQSLGGDDLPIDKKRQLSDLYVLYGGITPVAVETDAEGNITERILNASEASFTFYENGTYRIQVYDSIGNIQDLDVEITEIDRRAPVITNVAWSYKYLDENGAEQVVNYSITPGDEAGYNIVEDATYKLTNQDITATVTTDLATRFVGSESEEYNTQNSIVYDEDGWFNFNLERQNMLMDRYGLGLYLIDKEPPVIEEVEDLMFFENPNAGTPYDKSLLKYSAYDERYGEKTILTDKVVIDWGGFNPDDITANKFDKNKPYTVTYTVRDKVGNETVVKRKITLVGLFDAMARVNGIYPDSSGRIEVIGDSVEIGIDNFSGTAYARYEKGIHTMGEMKHIGTVIPQSGDKFTLERLTEGWYTFYIQTDLRDYFCINVYIYNK